MVEISEACQCPVPGVPCKKAITAEDMLCDRCRAACKSYFKYLAKSGDFVIPWDELRELPARDAEP